MYCRKWSTNVIAILLVMYEFGSLLNRSVPESSKFTCCTQKGLFTLNSDRSCQITNTWDEQSTSTRSISYNLTLTSLPIINSSWDPPQTPWQQSRPTGWQVCDYVAEQLYSSYHITCRCLHWEHAPSCRNGHHSRS